MLFCKGLVERIQCIKGGKESREDQLLFVINTYSEQFNKQRAIMYFESLPENLFWTGNYHFTLTGDESGQKFKPETISDFISVCESAGFLLEAKINIVDEDEHTIKTNKRLRWML